MSIAVDVKPQNAKKPSKDRRNSSIFTGFPLLIDILEDISHKRKQFMKLPDYSLFPTAARYRFSASFIAASTALAEEP